MKDGSLISCCSSLSLEILFKYPARYIIQVITGKKVEHVAIYIDNKIAECVLDYGVRILPFQEWLNQHKIKGMKIYENPLAIDLTDRQTENLRGFIKESIGKKYSIKEAITSVFDKLDYEKDNRTYCSEFVKDSYVRAGVLSYSFEKQKLNPAELVSLTKKLGLIQTRNRI